MTDTVSGVRSHGQISYKVIADVQSDASTQTEGTYKSLQGGCRVLTSVGSSTFEAAIAEKDEQFHKQLI